MTLKRDCPLPGDLPLQWGQARGRIKVGVEAGELLALLGEEWEESLARGGWAHHVKDKLDKGSRVYRAEMEEGQERQEVFIKHIRTAEAAAVMRARMRSEKGRRRPHHYPLKIIQIIFAGSVARRCWEIETLCRKAGLPVAEHLLYLSRRDGLFREEVLVTRGVNLRPASNARQYFEELAARPASPSLRAEKRELIAALGTFLAQVQKGGIRFPDFKLHNLIIQMPPNGAPRFVIVDLAEAEHRPQTEAEFVRHFAARLPGFSLLDRIRLAKAYLQAKNDGRSWRELCPLAAERGK